MASPATSLESVDGITVDAYCEQHGIRRVDVLKTDTEGHDLQVLQGADRMIRDGAVGWVLSEVTFDPTDHVHSQFSEIHSWLTARGLEVYCFYDHYFVREQKHHLFCNALFVDGRSKAERPEPPEPGV
jgi:hypothetical protein